MCDVGPAAGCSLLRTVDGIATDNIGSSSAVDGSDPESLSSFTACWNDEWSVAAVGCAPGARNG